MSVEIDFAMGLNAKATVFTQQRKGKLPTAADPTLKELRAHAIIDILRHKATWGSCTVPRLQQENAAS